MWHLHSEFKEFCKKFREFCEKLKVSPIPSWRLLWKNVLKKPNSWDQDMWELRKRSSMSSKRVSDVCHPSKSIVYREKQCALVSKPDIGFQFSQELLVHLFDWPVALVCQLLQALVGCCTQAWSVSTITCVCFFHLNDTKGILEEKPQIFQYSCLETVIW